MIAVCITRLRRLRGSAAENHDFNRCSNCTAPRTRLHDGSQTTRPRPLPSEQELRPMPKPHPSGIARNKIAEVPSLLHCCFFDA